MVTIGLGLNSVSSFSLVPSPPHRITTLGCIIATALAGCQFLKSLGYSLDNLVYIIVRQAAVQGDG